MSSFDRPSATGGGPIPAESSAAASATDGLAGFETRLLSELLLVAAEQAAAARQEPSRRAWWGKAGRVWPRPVVVTGAFSAALAAGVAAALTVTSITAGSQPAAARFVPATTVTAVLDNAATAAIHQPAVKPRPDQFVYTSMRLVASQPRRRGFPGERTTQTVESWRSVGGTRVGATVTSGPTNWTSRDQVTACVDGFVEPALTIDNKPRKQPCTARQYAAYRPWLPTTTAGMLAYLKGTAVTDGPAAQSVLEQAFYLLMDVDLTPAQQAAVYRALTKVPGLTIVPKMTDVLGRAGVGVRSRPAPGMTWTVIFSSTTFRLLGSDVEPVGPGYDRTAMAVQATIVNKVGQRP